VNQFSNITLISATLIVCAMCFSVFSYLKRKEVQNAMLSMIAAVSLLMLLLEPALIEGKSKALFLDSSDLRTSNAETAMELRDKIRDAALINLSGDGLFPAQWRDLPGRPVVWQEPKNTEAIQVNFSSQLQRGREFSLQVTRQQATQNWRLQLLAENGALLAEQSGLGAEHTVRWLPPLAERVVLQARLLNADGTILDQGPIPINVSENRPLQVLGRFDAPSFDVQSLHSLLSRSEAIIDWQTRLGKTLQRNEEAKVAIKQPELIVVDAAFLEQLNESARREFLQQVGKGASLIVLGANARQLPMWSQVFDLQLAISKRSKDALITVAQSLELSAAEVLPMVKSGASWQANQSENPWMWQRTWQKGNIVWLGVADWHRYAISQPLNFGVWWQAVLDQAQVRRDTAIAWEFLDAMPIANLRTAVCVQIGGEAGSNAGVKSVVVAEKAAAERVREGDDSLPKQGNNLLLSDLQQTIPLLARPEKMEGQCAAYWPQRDGWQNFQLQDGTNKQMLNETSAHYVYKNTDWLRWQSAIKREATKAYAARIPSSVEASKQALPALPFASLFVFVMLMLWWRERA
jgi:hypothetical protein